ncbi:MAG: hypothetical protein ACREMA_06060 [Longimicrobiales bacterium]
MKRVLAPLLIGIAAAASAAAQQQASIAERYQSQEVMNATRDGLRLHTKIFAPEHRRAFLYAG